MHTLSPTPVIPGFRQVPKTGVIYVVSRAAELGFRYDHPDWVNLGQGAPEAGMLPGAPQRLSSMDVSERECEYAPVAGLTELRQAVADFYNRFYRAGKASQYTLENVAICGGGRLALTRLAAAMGNVNMGHFLPDYTAYEELLTIFKAFTAIPIILPPEEGFRLSPEALEEKIRGLGLSALLLSNPCNPTGRHIRGQELSTWIDVLRRNDCTGIFDEFYSHYTYGYDDADALNMVSAAAYVEDVDTCPVIIVDGLTKNWRYPGLRISWTVGPRDVIEAIGSAGSFLDGGAPHPLQRAAVALLHPDHVRAENTALQNTFREKRDYTIGRLEAMGIRIPQAPEGAFYCWADLSDLPEPLRDGMAFFEAGLQEKVLTVPGIFFDVNPGRRRSNAQYRNFVRISFGPGIEALHKGLDGLERVVRQY